MTTAHWLIDKSALWRAEHVGVRAVLGPRVNRRLVAVCMPTELEIGYSARSGQDYALMRERLVDELTYVGMSDRAQRRAREVQAALVERGQHRSVGVADLLIAATAEIERLTVLHYDADFDLIAEVTGQPTEWIVPKGSI